MNDRFKFRMWDEGMFVGSKAEYRYADIFTGLTLKLASGKNNVEQCTGLKDENGNLIYEGDKVEITIFGSIGANGGYVDSDEIYKGTVVWDRDCFLVKTDTDTLLLPHSEDCIKIIGNIHENKGE